MTRRRRPIFEQFGKLIKQQVRGANFLNIKENSIAQSFSTIVRVWDESCYTALVRIEDVSDEYLNITSKRRCQISFCDIRDRTAWFHADEERK